MIIWCADKWCIKWDDPLVLLAIATVKHNNKHAATCIISLIVFHLHHKKSPFIAFVVFLLQWMSTPSLTAQRVSLIMLYGALFDESLKLGWISFKVFQKWKYYFGKLVIRTNTTLHFLLEQNLIGEKRKQ